MYKGNEENFLFFTWTTWFFVYVSPSKSYSLFRLYSPTNRRYCIHGLLVTFVSYIGNEDAYVGNRFVLNDGVSYIAFPCIQ